MVRAEGPFRDARHVVASNGDAGRALGAASSPLLWVERESKLFKTDLGIAGALEDELFVSSTEEICSRQDTGTNVFGVVQVQAFVRASRVVTVVFPR